METERLIIREICLDDLDALYDIYSDSSITRYMEGLYEDRKEEEEFTVAYIKNMYGFYGYGIWILQKKDGTIIGRAGLSNREYNGEFCVEAGYVIGAAYQRRGYATEALNAIIMYAKRELEVNTVYSFILKENLPSLYLAKKCGFTREGSAYTDEQEYEVYVHKE